MKAFLLVVDALLAGIVVLSMLPLQGWWSRAGEVLRLQIAVAAAILLLVQLSLFPNDAWLWIANATLIACLLFELAWILPYTVFFPREVRPASRPPDEEKCISILSANVLMSNRNADALKRQIEARDPDIVLLLEGDDWWQQNMQWLRETHPHGLDCARDNRYGMHLYSRLPLQNPQLEYLVEQDVPSMHAPVLLRSGDKVALRCLHPAPPVPGERTTSEQRDAELLVVARAIAKTRERVIVTGDLNDVGWSPTTRLFRKISRLLDPRIGRGMFNTFHADIPLLRFPLDHVFHSRDFRLVELAVLDRFGSDHLPIYFKLQLEPDASEDQSAPPADQDDKAQARKRSERENADPSDVPELESDRQAD